MEDYFLITDWQALIRVSDKKYPVYMPEVRAENPNTGFPIPIREYILEPFGYMPVYDVELPSGDVLIEGAPEFKDDGKWYRTWTVREFTPEELAERLAAAKQGLEVSVSQIVYMDTLSGASLEEGEDEILVDISADAFPFLVSMHQVAQNSTEGSLFDYKDLQGNFLTLTKEQVLDLFNRACQARYAIQKNSLGYLKRISNAEKQEDLPVLPETFRE